MPSRHELNSRARNAGFDPSTIANDSKLEQKVLWLEKRGAAKTGTAASSTLTSNATDVSDADTITIGNTTYTFKTTLVAGTPNQIHIGGTASATLDNIKAAITLTGTPGTDYTAATVKNPDVDATTKTATTLLVVSRDTNAGDDTATTKSAATLSWTGSTLGAQTAGVAGVIAQANSFVRDQASGLAGDKNVSI